MIENINKLEDLAETVVPINFQVNSPQFFGLVKAFLANIQETQEVINSNFLDMIDYDSIKNTDFKQIYINTYLAMFEFKDLNNIDALNDLVNISKDVSSVKGTGFLYTILLKLLYFIDPTVDTQYSETLAEYNAETDPTKRAELKEELDALKSAGLENGFLLYEEVFDTNGDLIPFTYKVTTDLNEEIFTKYLKRFAHPSGWDLNYVNGIFIFASETIELTENTALYVRIPFPNLSLDGEQLVEYYNPEKIIDDIIIGDISDLANITSKIVNTSRIYVVGSDVYYRLEHFNGMVTVGDETTGSVNVEYYTPPASQIRWRGGGYTLANTSELSTMNGGVNFSGGIKITYKIRVSD